MLKNPLGYPFLLTTLTLMLTPPLDITLVGDANQDITREILKAIYARYLPERRLVVKNPRKTAALEKIIPEMQFYTMQGGVPTAYICQNAMCLTPITKLQELTSKIAQLISQKVGP